MKLRLYSGFILLGLIVPLLAQSQIQWEFPPYRYYQYENGFELLVIENHTNPLVSVVVIVRAGLRNETAANNGVSHMLEHMTFNGTTKRTQKQLYDELDSLGIYLNAHTDMDYTNYLALTHRDFLEQSVEIMADMLLNSTFPEEKFEKEKGIIVEEVGKDSDNPDYQKNLRFRQQFLAGTPYAMPVIGTVETIRNMRREQVVEYYQTYYQPNNMMAVVFGDVNPDAVNQLFQSYFGELKPKAVPQLQFEWKRDYPFVHQEMNAERKLVYLVFPAPTFNNRYFIPFTIFFNYALESDKSRLMERLIQNESVSIRQASASYEYHPDFAYVILTFDVPADVDATVLKREVITEFQHLQQEGIREEEFQLIVRNLAISDILQRDQVMYYGFFKSHEFAIAGKTAFEVVMPALLELEVAEVNRFIQEYPRMWHNPTVLYQPFPWMKKVDVAAYHGKAQGRYRGVGEIHRTVFPNGLTLVHLYNTDSPILGIHLLFKNRSAWESPDKAGLVEMLHRMLLKRTRNYTAEEITKKLKYLGAEVKTYDWDYIPFDDYYNVPEYSYIRFKTLDQFGEQAFALLAEVLQNAVFTEEDFEQVKRRMLAVAQKNQKKASFQARYGFFRLLLGKDHPLSRPVGGTQETIQNITLQDVQQLKARYFQANNLIISVVSGIEPETMKQLVKRYFGGMPAGEHPPAMPTIDLTQGLAADFKVLDKQQAQLYWGYVFENRASGAALAVANHVFSNRLAFHLREQKGWAYRLGSSVQLYGDKGIFYVRMGTRPYILQDAILAIQADLESFRSEVLPDNEIERSRNALLAAKVRRRATRENQAYFLGLFEFLGYPEDYYFRSLESLKNVSPEEVNRVKNQFIQTENYRIYWVK
ncbi:MAG: insulinase family protein [Calditrichaeota bacterium]|nr:insulinase family protein [Calditrichota bacterium]